jgi:cobalt-zinc-cadmium efflux system protein
VGERRVTLLLVLVLAYMGVEVAAGVIGGSLALVADAGHMASDAAALAITLWALRITRRPATPERTFGWHRAEILAAAVNGAALLAISGGVLWEAAGRFASPAPFQAPLVVGVAAGGLVVNVAGLFLLHDARDAGHNLRSAWLHVLSDALGSAGAMLAGGCAWAFGWTWADPAASVLIALLVVRAAWRLLDESVHVLMEGAPAHIDVNAVRGALLAHPGVRGVHDLHVWTITSGQVAMSGHVQVEAGADSAELLRGLGALLKERFALGHATLQLEPPGFDDVHGGELHP